MPYAVTRKSDGCVALHVVRCTRRGREHWFHGALHAAAFWAAAMKMPQSTVTAVQGRSQNRCERCGTSSAYRWSLHHRLPRGMGGTRDPELNNPCNVLHLCGSGTEGCHGWVESNRTISYEFGWLVRRGFEPSQVPFTDLDGRWWLLHGDTKLPLEFGFTPPNPRQ